MLPSLALVWIHPLKVVGSWVDFFEDTTGNQKSKLYHVPLRDSDLQLQPLALHNLAPENKVHVLSD